MVVCLVVDLFFLCVILEKVLVRLGLFDGFFFEFLIKVVGGVFFFFGLVVGLFLLVSKDIFIGFDVVGWVGVIFFLYVVGKDWGVYIMFWVNEGVLLNFKVILMFLLMVK